MLTVVTYDVPDNRRRQRLHALLEGYGIAVQRSVFECDLQPAALARLVERAARLIDVAEDDVRAYPLCARCHAARTHAGPGPTGEQQRYLLL
jgi:CRISPR-associated protein Cas2